MNTLRWETLHTGNLHLDPVELDDTQELWHGVDADRPHLGEWLPWVDLWSSPGHAQAWIEAAELQAELSNGGSWLIRRNGILLGNVTVHWIQWEHRCASLGWWLFSHATGQGVMRQSVQRVVDWLFFVARLHRLEVSCAVENPPSQRLARALGFLEEGVRREVEYLRGRYWDHRGFALLQSDWELTRTHR